ncbi:hypothetical protein J4558_12910 [Leptolyngbya sp. 15MV]|nr:hypothetical protein J4558_12910 [Leptolyngbya sp. 15MV]
MLLKLAALSALGYAGYKVYEKNRDSSQPAFAGNQGKTAVRDAGPEAMRDKPASWSKTDEASDQSFPASDPPATY